MGRFRGGGSFSRRSERTRSRLRNLVASASIGLLLFLQGDDYKYCFPLHVVAAFSSTVTVPAASTTTVSELVSGDTPWNALVGEADRAFKYAIGTYLFHSIVLYNNECLECNTVTSHASFSFHNLTQMIHISALDKNGRARAAAGAFHEAATLYQCFLDSPSEFGHVTALTSQECLQILAYAALSLGYLNLDVLQSPNAAARLYERATTMDPTPTAVGFDGMGQSLEAAGRPLEEAVQAYRQALKLQADSPKVQFHLAVALDRLKQTDDDDEYARESNQLLESLRREEAVHACLVDSWGYVRWHMRHLMDQKKRNQNLYRGTRDMLELALAAAEPLIQQQGWVCEFGVGSGRSLRITQEILPLDQAIHGFDTFTGLPQAWGLKPAGTYSTGGRVPVMDENQNVFFYKGLFRDTIPTFLEQQQQRHGDGFLAYAAIDCRLYKSTLDILEGLHGRIVPGTILAFSEYIGHPTWRQDEFRAWRECCKRFGWKYEYMAFSLSTRQAVVRVMSA